MKCTCSLFEVEMIAMKNCWKDLFRKFGKRKNAESAGPVGKKNNVFKNL